MLLFFPLFSSVSRHFWLSKPPPISIVSFRAVENLFMVHGYFFGYCCPIWLLSSHQEHHWFENNQEIEEIPIPPPLFFYKSNANFYSTTKLKIHPSPISSINLLSISDQSTFNLLSTFYQSTINLLSILYHSSINLLSNF